MFDMFARKNYYNDELIIKVVADNSMLLKWSLQLYLETWSALALN